MRVNSRSRGEAPRPAQARARSSGQVSARFSSAINDWTRSRNPEESAIDAKCRNSPESRRRRTRFRSTVRCWAGDSGVTGWEVRSRICSAKSSKVSTCGSTSTPPSRAVNRCEISKVSRRLGASHRVVPNRRCCRASRSACAYNSRKAVVFPAAAGAQTSSMVPDMLQARISSMTSPPTSVNRLNRPPW